MAQPRFRRLNKIDFTRFTTSSPLSSSTASDEECTDPAAQLRVLRAMDFSHLTELHLSGCAALADVTLAEAVLHLAASLRILDLARCNNLVHIVGNVLETCMALEELRVSDMQGLELVRIETPWSARLRVVQFHRCWALRAMHITSQDLEHVSVLSCTYQ